MSVVIMAYAGDVFKEYFLPAINNADDSVCLEGELFSLGGDVYLNLEVLDNQWSFRRSSEYSISGRDGADYFEKKIKNGDVLSLRYGTKKITLIVTESANTFQIFRKYDISNMSEVLIGSSGNNHIQYSFLNYMSRNHAVLQRTQQGWVLYDTSSNGTFVESRRIGQPYVLNFGDCITIFGLRIIFLGKRIAVCDNFGTDKVNVRGIAEYYQQYTPMEKRKAAGLTPPAEKKYFKRAPRNMGTLYTDPIEIEGPPALRVTKDKPLFMVIGPSFTMTIPMMLGSLMVIIAMSTGGRSASAYMFTGIVTAVASAILGVMWALTNIRYEKQVKLEEQEQRFNAYGNYLIEIADTLKEQYETNQEVMRRTYLPADTCLGYNENTIALWNRNIRHEDFLMVRLGTGSTPFQVPINIPKQKFELYSDELKEKPKEIKENYSTLYDVPVCIDLLKKHLVGVVGGAQKAGARQVVQDMVAQIAANNCYTDVKMVFLYEANTDGDRKFWEFARWLPHVWTSDRKIRFVAEDKNEVSDVCYELAQILRQRVENPDEEEGSEERPLPHYILFVENPKLLYGELLAKYALDPKDEYGLSTILMVERYEDLPNSCEDIIENDGKKTCVYNLTESDDAGSSVTFDWVDGARLEQFTRRLLSVEVNEAAASGEIPASIDFFEMQGVRTLQELDVAERWAKNRTYDSMKALIGKKSGGEDCYLDIHEKYHGPHGLVAGTTGSGKSETLQTYMLSLAVNFSPYDIGYFIIDFKGGGMANLFSNLPHLIGQISNLSGNQVRRAMISIKSEIKRRQRVFTENNVNNINLYTRLYKNGEAAQPIPHLFIIIDEFAELKREEPEFMKELISVAQVGRSLGVHLILATQKPSGTVDDNIWSNSKFRICLRVQDRQDSNDMLHKPDAAYITQAGAGFLQVGNDEIFEQFQSGYSGAAYDAEGTGKGAIASMITVTGKAAVVGNRMKKRRKLRRQHEWLVALIAAYRNAAESFGMTLDIAVLTNRFDEMYGMIFEEIARGGYSYEDSEAMRQRMSEMAYAVLGMLELSDDEIADRLMEQADRHALRLPEMQDKTQLDAVVDYLGKIARENNYTESMALWLPVLPENLLYESLEGTKEETYRDGKWPSAPQRWGLSVKIGLYDDPENQEQQPFVLDPGENGHYAVCGTVVTGKSTLLQTMVYAMICRYSPQWVNFYLLDFSTRVLACFEDAPHVGGIVLDDNPERLRKFMHMLERMMDERKTVLRGGNYSQYVRANGVRMPAIVVVLDGYANFREKTDGAYDATLQRLAREGQGYGIFWITSSAGFGSTEIPNRIGSNIRNVVTLDMGDRFKFAETLRVTRVEILPEMDVKGRGLANVGGRILEFQTALAVEASDDYERIEKITLLCRDMAAHWKGFTARSIPEIPEKPMLADFAKKEEYVEMLKGGRLPAAYHLVDASYFGVSLRTSYCYLISGKTRTGKTSYLKNLIYAAGRYRDAEICIIENQGTGLKKLADSLRQAAGSELVDMETPADASGLAESAGEAGFAGTVGTAGSAGGAGTAGFAKSAGSADAGDIGVPSRNISYLQTDEEIFRWFKGTIDTFKRRNLKKRRLAEELEEAEIFDAMSEERPYFIFIADLTDFIAGIYRKLENGSSMSGYVENILERGRYHRFYFFACMNTDDAVKNVSYKAYNVFAGYKQGVHLGGNINTQRLFSFSNIPFAEQGKATKPGQGYVPSEEDASIAESIVIPYAKGL